MNTPEPPDTNPNLTPHSEQEKEPAWSSDRPRNFTPPQPEPYEKTYLEGDNSFSNIINHLLKKPLSIVHTIDEDKQKISFLPIFILTVIALALFGFIIGTFSGVPSQMWEAPLKIIVGVFFSALICFPSLYIFSCIGGLDVRFKTTGGILICTLAITSLLLIGFAPVIWLFSSSSDSTPFFGFLAMSIWLISLFIGLKFLTKTGKAFGMQHTKHLYLWAAIFTLVTLQMPTTLRPLIAPEPNEPFLNLKEKKFFIQHWLESDRAHRYESDRTDF